MAQDIRHWFERAVNVTAGRRAAFLEGNCPDEAVRSEVLSLLEYDTTLSGTPPAIPVPAAVVQQVLEAALGSREPALPAQRVGPFELGKLLGSGGMGLVYEAHRVDGEVRQRVAVKFAQIPSAADQKAREAAFRRFYRERQMLASLRHPYIASLIDAGSTSEGMPYAVLEQVDGIPIDRYCEAEGLNTAERIGLVLKLCEAVQFAHRHLIVHSDIKPDNVLVTADGIPKLIDFGIANDLGEEPTLSTIRGFTPGYASPEQSQGHAPTVATDVFGVGAVLYRLLTGSKPWAIPNGPLRAILQHLSEEEVVRPSPLKPELRGDLENILLKALQREPHRRYGSVPEFADDLNRYLARRPVRASPDSTVYRTSRFVRRHWMMLTVFTALFCSLATATAVSLRQKQQAMQRAMESRQLAERLLFEVHDEIDGVLGGTKAREKLGSIAVQYLEGLEREYGRNRELAWELLNAYSRLGQSRAGAAASVGDTKSGLQFARKTLELGAVVEGKPLGPDRLDQLFGVYSRLVLIFGEAGQPKLQRETIDRMLRIAQQLSPLRQAQALKELARYHDQNTSAHEAVQPWSQALSILRTLTLSPTKPAGTDQQLISTLVGIGRAQSVAGNFSGAVGSLQEAIRLSESSIAADPHLAKSARQLYWSHLTLGDVFGAPLRFNLGRPQEAAEQYQKARKIAQTLVNADPANEMAKLDLARTFLREGAALAATDPGRALAVLEHADAVLSGMPRESQAGLEARILCLTTMVGPLLKVGDPARARSQTADAWRLVQQIQQSSSQPVTRGILRAESVQLHASGQTGEAIAVTQKLLALLPARTSPVLSDNFETVEALERLRDYSGSADPGTCSGAAGRLTQIWAELRTSHPQSSFVLSQGERAQAAQQEACAPAARF